jgi:hypothetical protein
LVALINAMLILAFGPELARQRVGRMEVGHQARSFATQWPARPAPNANRGARSGWA